MPEDSKKPLGPKLMNLPECSLCDRSELNESSYLVELFFRSVQRSDCERPNSLPIIYGHSMDTIWTQPQIHVPNRTFVIAGQRSLPESKLG